ncbi:bacillithiol biosynthesis BshC [Candidatus Bathyarchaeota archaeon]|nr:bacillithiol biosynthesis BshC [Candidatus Bathyarchaeota archaeon]
MTQQESSPPAHRLYTDYVESGSRGETATELWGRIPATMGEAYKLLGGIREAYGSAPDEIEDLKKSMKANMRGLGVLTSKASENIDRLDRGAIETGQQPYALGGSSLILNKIAYISSLSGLGGEGYAPLFFVADYDGVQAELLNTRVPSPSPRGLLFSYPAGPEYESVPIYELPNPPEPWLVKALENLRGNYKGLLRDADPHVRDRELLNLEHAITILKGAYYSTENVSDWSTKTIGTLINLESDLGVPILPFSMPGSRRLFQSGYELLLVDTNRERFIEATNLAAELVEASGHRAGIGLREPDYVPFFLECQASGCNGSRVELKYSREAGSATASVSGKCPRCGAVHEFTFDAGSPDLTDIVENISPRVDSRQIIVDSVVPVLAHVGGPGETSYYAEVIPGARALSLPFPVFLRYTRLFYNTPWNDSYAQTLMSRGCCCLTDGGLFEALSSWVEARNSGDPDGLRGAHIAIRGCIEATAGMLEDTLSGLKAEIEDIKGSLRKPGDRKTLIQEMRRKQTQAQEIELYMSSALGKFSPERFGQEVSWAWLDVATVAGVGDLMGVFLRQYSENTPNSSMFYVNL